MKDDAYYNIKQILGGSNYLFFIIHKMYFLSRLVCEGDQILCVERNKQRFNLIILQYNVQ